MPEPRDVTPISPPEQMAKARGAAAAGPPDTESHDGQGVEASVDAESTTAGAAPGAIPAPTAPAAATPLAAHRRARTPGIALDCGASERTPHVGVVFVHGIGSQKAGETLRDWGGTLVRSLAEFRTAAGSESDPVVTCQLDPSSPGNLHIEVEMPASQGVAGELPAEHWVLTEAWWAGRVSPPSFARMAEWLSLGGAIRRILQSMFLRRSVGDPRHRTASESHRLCAPDATRSSPYEGSRQLSMLEEPGAPLPLDRRPAQPGDSSGDPTVDGCEDDQGPASPGPAGRVHPGRLVLGFERLGIGLFLQAASALLLLLYGVLRSIEKLVPIPPLRNGGLTRPIDDFVLDWFGDVHVLLGDPAQSASVRGRLTDAIWDLNAIGCNPVAIVAHSGGAIVTYLTLTDPATRDLRVDRVLTLGEGLNLAWRLTDAGRAANEEQSTPRDLYSALYRDLSGRSYPVAWTDFWASQDPAPVGVLEFPGIEPPRIESIGVWNRLSFGDDHGGYWDNDEEFVIPLLRRLQRRAAEVRSGFSFGSDDAHRRRSTRRRERLILLSIWTQLARVLPAAVVVHAFAVGADSVVRTGQQVTALWNAVPGHEIVSDVVVAIRAPYPGGPPDGSIERILAEVGVRLIAIVFALAAIFALRGPSERSAVFERSWVFGILNLAHSIGWRVVVLLLVILAGSRFLALPFSTGTLLGIQVVVGVVAIAALDVAISGRVRRALQRPPTRIGIAVGEAIMRLRDRLLAGRTWFALQSAMIALVLAAGIVLLAAPFVALAMFPDVGDNVLGALAIAAAFQVLYAVGRWRWLAWDARERADARRAEPDIRGRFHVGVQTTLTTMAALLLYVGIAQPWFHLLGLHAILWAGLVTLAVILLGIGIDVIDAGNRRVARPGERIAEMIRSKY